MANEAKISVSGMRAEAAEITTLNTNMAAEFAAIVEAIRVLKGKWQGDAANEAINATNKMQPKFEDFQNAVRTGVNSMYAHADKWEAAEKQIQNIQTSSGSQFR